MSNRCFEKHRIYESIETLQRCLDGGNMGRVEDFLDDLLAVVEAQMDLIYKIDNQCDHNYDRIVELEADVQRLEEE